MLFWPLIPQVTNPISIQTFLLSLNWTPADKKEQGMTKRDSEEDYIWRHKEDWKDVERNGKDSCRQTQKEGFGISLMCH